MLVFKRINLKSPSTQSGFSLLEMLAVLAILAIMTDFALRESEANMDQRVANGVVDDVNRIQRAAMRFYRNLNAWPTNANALVSNGYLSSGEEKDGWGNTYIVGVSGQDLTVTVNVQEQRYLSLVRGKLPRVSASGTTLTSFIDKPGEEAAHEALYARDGSRALTGPMDANDQNINNANNLTAKRYFDAENAGYYVDPASTSNLNGLDVKRLRIVANAKIGDECITKTIATTSDGTIVSCKGGMWAASVSEMPVGTVISLTVPTNPSILLGYGTWVEFASGRTLVGQNTSDSSFDELEETGGSKTDSHRLTVNEMPEHRHTQGYRVESGGHSIYGYKNVGSGDVLDHIKRHSRSVPYTSTEGGNQPHTHDIVQPYIVVRMWKRIS